MSHKHETLQSARAALGLAAEKGEVHLVKLLHEAIQDSWGAVEAKRCLNHGSSKGVSPLMRACLGGSPHHTECASLLINLGADALAKTGKGDTILHVASKNGHAELLQKLLHTVCPTETHNVADTIVDGVNGPTKLVDVHNGSGLTAVQLATLKGSAASILALLRAGAAIDAPTLAPVLSPQLSQGSTALHIAALRGNGPCAAALLDFQRQHIQGIELRRHRNSRGFKPSQLARMAGHHNLARSLSESLARQRERVGDDPSPGGHGPSSGGHGSTPGSALESARGSHTGIGSGGETARVHHSRRGERGSRREGAQRAALRSAVTQEAILGALAQRARLLLSLRTLGADVPQDKACTDPGEKDDGLSEVVEEVTEIMHKGGGSTGPAESAAVLFGLIASMGSQQAGSEHPSSAPEEAAQRLHNGPVTEKGLKTYAAAALVQAALNAMAAAAPGAEPMSPTMLVPTTAAAAALVVQAALRTLVGSKHGARLIASTLEATVRDLDAGRAARRARENTSARSLSAPRGSNFSSRGTTPTSSAQHSRNTSPVRQPPFSATAHAHPSPVQEGSEGAAFPPSHSEETPRSTSLRGSGTHRLRHASRHASEVEGMLSEPEMRSPRTSSLAQPSLQREDLAHVPRRRRGESAVLRERESGTPPLHTPRETPPASPLRLRERAAARGPSRLQRERRGGGERNEHGERSEQGGRSQYGDKGQHGRQSETGRETPVSPDSAVYSADITPMSTPLGSLTIPEGIRLTPSRVHSHALPVISPSTIATTVVPSGTGTPTGVHTPSGTRTPGHGVRSLLQGLREKLGVSLGGGSPCGGGSPTLSPERPRRRSIEGTSHGDAETSNAPLEVEQRRSVPNSFSRGLTTPSEAALALSFLKQREERCRLAELEAEGETSILEASDRFEPEPEGLLVPKTQGDEESEADASHGESSSASEQKGKSAHKGSLDRGSGSVFAAVKQFEAQNREESRKGRDGRNPCGAGGSSSASISSCAESGGSPPKGTDDPQKGIRRFGSLLFGRKEVQPTSEGEGSTHQKMPQLAKIHCNSLGGSTAGPTSSASTPVEGSGMDSASEANLPSRLRNASSVLSTGLHRERSNVSNVSSALSEQHSMDPPQHSMERGPVEWREGREGHQLSTQRGPVEWREGSQPGSAMDGAHIHALLLRHQGQQAALMRSFGGGAQTPLTPLGDDDTPVGIYNSAPPLFEYEEDAGHLTPRTSRPQTPQAASPLGPNTRGLVVGRRRSHSQPTAEVQEGVWNHQPPPIRSVTNLDSIMLSSTDVYDLLDTGVYGRGAPHGGAELMRTTRGLQRTEIVEGQEEEEEEAHSQGTSLSDLDEIVSGPDMSEEQPGSLLHQGSPPHSRNRTQQGRAVGQSSVGQQEGGLTAQERRLTAEPQVEAPIPCPTAPHPRQAPPQIEPPPPISLQRKTHIPRLRLSQRVEPVTDTTHQGSLPVTPQGSLPATPQGEADSGQHLSILERVRASRARRSGMGSLLAALKGGSNDSSQLAPESVASRPGSSSQTPPTSARGSRRRERGSRAEGSGDAESPLHRGFRTARTAAKESVLKHVRSLRSAASLEQQFTPTLSDLSKPLPTLPTAREEEEPLEREEDNTERGERERETLSAPGAQLEESRFGTESKRSREERREERREDRREDRRESRRESWREERREERAEGSGRGEAEALSQVNRGVISSTELERGEEKGGSSTRELSIGQREVFPKGPLLEEKENSPRGNELASREQQGQEMVTLKNKFCKPALLLQTSRLRLIPLSPVVEEGETSSPQNPQSNQRPSRRKGKERVAPKKREDESCAICMDEKLEVRVDGCEHALCARCAYQLCARGLAAPLCPFCRNPIKGFISVKQGDKSS